MNLQGLSGGLLQMISHGITTGALFLIVGFLYERRHTRLIVEFRWSVESHAGLCRGLHDCHISRRLALPGTNGFVGEFLILVGAFEGGLRVFAVCCHNSSCHPGGSLHAVDVPAGYDGQGDEPEERKSERLVSPGNWPSCCHC